MEFSGQRVVVMGLGRFGGGVGAARFMIRAGAEVLVTDQEPAERLADSLAQLNAPGTFPEQGKITYRLGEHVENDFTTADLIVVNPAVDPRGNRFLRAARGAGVPTTSEIRLLVERLPDRRRTIGVTGTAGKSTVTAMIGHLLGQILGCGGVHVGGNLGGSLLEKVSDIRADHWIVLELSSFMLEGLAEVHWSPHIALVTNIAPNHLDRYGGFADYVRAKQAILVHQRDGDVALLGRSVAEWPTAAGVGRRLVDEPNGKLVSLPGLHNQFNAAFAVAVGREIAAGGSDLGAAMRGFCGLPHRLQPVCEHDGVRYVNDSKSTTPQAAMLALRSFDRGIVHVILGGYDKGSDLEPLAGYAAAHGRAIYTMGATGGVIRCAAAAFGGDAELIDCRTLDRAVAEAVRRVGPGDVVLLSPGCASWDQFENFEQRGATFVEAVRRYATGKK